METVSLTIGNRGMVSGAGVEPARPRLSNVDVYLGCITRTEMVPAEGVEPPVLSPKGAQIYSLLQSPLCHAGNVKDLWRKARESNTRRRVTPDATH